jgi:hypothetical protein
MVGVWREGETSTATCTGCGKVVSTTCRHRDVPFDDGSGVVPNILVSVCDHCDEVVGIPAQSTGAIKAERSA